MVPTPQSFSLRGPRMPFSALSRSTLAGVLACFVTMSVFRFQLEPLFFTTVTSYMGTSTVELNTLAPSISSDPELRDPEKKKPPGVSFYTRSHDFQIVEKQNGSSNYLTLKLGDIKSESTQDQSKGNTRETEAEESPDAKDKSHDRTEYKSHPRSAKKSKSNSRKGRIETETNKQGDELHFPETETLSRFQSRVSKVHKEVSTLRHKDRHSLRETNVGQIGNKNETNVGLQVENIIHPSLYANSTPFEAGQCYRQVHLWRQETPIFSKRGGDFPCPGLACGLRFVVDTNFENLKSSDAVILFHRTKWDWAEMHRHRPRGQKWIFFTRESPFHTKIHVIPPKEFYNSYDYIMTYRSTESHLYGAYGRYNTDRPELKFTETRNWTLHKNSTTPVAWMASNCKIVTWDRKGFVEALSRYIPVTMYGRCGTKDCPKDESCNEMLRKHKFYLALENSACRDYITEKVWRNAYLNNIVPVVYGPPREDYERVLPPDSFIHVHDFDTIKELAQYLMKLNKDEDLYNTYFEWKKFGSVQDTMKVFEPEQVCSSIVSRLLEDEKAMKDGTYQPPMLPDWNEWWTNSCQKDSPKWPIKLE